MSVNCAKCKEDISHVLDYIRVDGWNFCNKCGSIIQQEVDNLIEEYMNDN